MRTFLVVFFLMCSTIAGSHVGAETDVVHVHLLERNGCGVTVSAEADEPALTQIRPADLCFIVQAITHATGVEIDKTHIYLISFLPWHSNAIPELVAAYKRNNLEVWNFFNLMFLGYNYGEGVIQVDPRVFQPSLEFSTLYTTDRKHIKNITRWMSMSVIAHELLHQVLTQMNVAADDQHCLMVYPPFEYATAVSKKLADRYGVKEKTFELYRMQEKSNYTGQCALWILSEH